MVLKGVKCDSECPIGSRYGIWVVPFQILRDTVPQIHTLKVWVIAWVECPTLGIELIGKLQLLV